jgi:hypothetical protein
MRDRAKSLDHVGIRIIKEKENVKTDDIKINRTWLHVSSSIYISFIQQENVSSLFTVYPCRVCEQTNGEQKKKNKTERKKVLESIERMCIKTNKTARTHVYSRCDKIEKNDRQRKEKTKTKMSYE